MSGLEDEYDAEHNLGLFGGDQVLSHMGIDPMPFKSPNSISASSMAFASGVTPPDGGHRHPSIPLSPPSPTMPPPMSSGTPSAVIASSTPTPAEPSVPVASGAISVTASIPKGRASPGPSRKKKPKPLEIAQNLAAGADTAGQHFTWSSLILQALLTLGENKTGQEITSFIEEHHPELLANKTKTWKNSVMGCLSSNARRLWTKEQVEINGKKRYVWRLRGDVASDLEFPASAARESTTGTEPSEPCTPPKLRTGPSFDTTCEGMNSPLAAVTLSLMRKNRKSRLFSTDLEHFDQHLDFGLNEDPDFVAQATKETLTNLAFAAADDTAQRPRLDFEAYSTREEAAGRAEHSPAGGADHFEMM